MREKLWDKLDRKELIVAPGVAIPYFARMSEYVGFEALYMTGGGTAQWVTGFPDVGLTTLTEMAMNAGNICNAVNVPVIADIDTGYGNAINAMRAVREYEKAGVAGFHIEDQVTPKKCGALKGKVLVPKEEFIGKIKACVEARDDPNLLLIARCDARGTQTRQGELYDRCNAYLKAGADMIFPERPTSIAELEEDIANIHGRVLLNGSFLTRLRLGVIPGDLSIDDVAKMGFSVLIFPIIFQVANSAIYDFLVEMKQTRRHPFVKRVPQEISDEIIGLPQVGAYEEEFLPKEDIMAMYGTTEVPREAFFFDDKGKTRDDSK
jgi:2-methylisocitrate lyase-like PEP mutase family enzyme